MVTEFAFHAYPGREPGFLSDFRMELVNNAFLACVSTSIDLVSCMELTQPSLGHALEAYRAWCLPALAASPNPPPGSGSGKVEVPLSLSLPLDLLFWKSGPSCPKAASDMYESMLGAIFVDCGFDLDVLRPIVRHTLLDPWVWRFQRVLTVTPTFSDINPPRLLADWMGKTLHCQAYSGACSENDVSLGFAYHMHGRSLGFAQGPSKKAAKDSAARIALAYIQANMEDIRAICDCQQREADRVALECKPVPVHAPAHIRFDGVHETEEAPNDGMPEPPCAEALDEGCLFAELFDEVETELSGMPEDVAEVAEVELMEMEDVEGPEVVAAVELALSDDSSLASNTTTLKENSQPDSPELVGLLSESPLPKQPQALNLGVSPLQAPVRIAEALHDGLYSPLHVLIEEEEEEEE